MGVRIDLTGRQFSNLTVLSLAVDNPTGKKKWLCKCTCGNEIIVAGCNLQSGHTKGCKQCQLKRLQQDKIRHGMSDTKLYGVWAAMRNRCNNPKNKSYSDYGGRGIRVCEEWESSDEFFKWALENGYHEGLEIDRINTDGDYCPSNCRWIPRVANARNKRNNVLIKHGNDEKTISEWAEYYGVNYKNLCRNLKKGYSLDEAIQREKSGDRSHRKA